MEQQPQFNPNIGQTNMFSPEELDKMASPAPKPENKENTGEPKQEEGKDRFGLTEKDYERLDEKDKDWYKN